MGLWTAYRNTESSYCQTRSKEKMGKHRELTHHLHILKPRRRVEACIGLAVLKIRKSKAEECELTCNLLQAFAHGIKRTGSENSVNGYHSF